MTSELAAKHEECVQAATEYEANAAQLSKSISSLTGAITSLESSKSSTKAESFLEQEAGSFLEAEVARSGIDPSNPEFQYHSDDIIQLMQGLLKESKSKKSDLDSEWQKKSAGCAAAKKAYQDRIGTNNDAIA